MNILILAQRLTRSLVCLLFLITATKSSMAQTGPSVLFIRGADRSGGFLEAGDDAARTEHLSDIFNSTTNGGNHSWGELRLTLESEGFTIEQWAEPVEPGAPATGPTEGIGLTFDSASLSAYDVLVLGSNNAVYSQDSIDAVEGYIRGGGGAIFISDANFGGNWADASNSDQQFLDRFGLIANQDLGTYSIDRADGEFLIPDHPIFDGVDSFDGEGVTPMRVGSLTAGVNVEILAQAEGSVRRNNGTPGIDDSLGSAGAGDANDAALLFASVDQGRVIGHFDRNTFFNENGAGTNINRLDNRQFAINLFQAAAGSSTIPEPTSGVLLLASLTGWCTIRRRR